MVTTACTPTAAARSTIARTLVGVGGAAGIEVGVRVDQAGSSGSGAGGGCRCRTLLTHRNTIR